MTERDSEHLVDPLLLEVLDTEHALGNTDLPIAQHRTEIVDAVAAHSVSIIVAPTGSGKTTQVPQFVREMRNADGTRPLFDEIVVTQPRIVAVTTLTDRVTEEVQKDTQNVHVVGGHTSKWRSPTRQRDEDITLQTDGIAAAQLLHRPTGLEAGQKRILIIDEVHEWNLNIELLIAQAARRTNPRSPDYDPNLKVVIMSATMDAVRLANFFDHANPPIIEVHVPTFEITDEVTDKSVAEAALQIAQDTKGKVLAFHAGKRQIESSAIAISILQNEVPEAERVAVVRLHGQQSAEEQSEAFKDYPNGAVILTTNVAQTSITVPETVAVVDGGQHRINRMRHDVVPGGSEGLYLENTALSDYMQRRGRTGRTCDGLAVLAVQNGGVPKPLNERAPYPTPAIQRESLDGLVLRLRAAGHDPRKYRFFHKPPAEALDGAEHRLRVLGALDDKGQITERGLKMESLPLDPELACMLVFAEEQGMSSEVKQHVFDIAVLMQRGGILSRSPKEQGWRDLLVEDSHGETAEKQSDYFAQLEAYITLSTQIEPEHWDEYDVIVHNVELIEQDRESLARNMGRPLHVVTPIDPKNRHDVLTCIYAGQLNQIWRRIGEKWTLLIGPNYHWEASASSVVGTIGKLATGKLFTLGTDTWGFDSIQDMNEVVSTQALERAAEQLIRDVEVEGTVQYDTDRQTTCVTVARRLGPLILRTYKREVDISNNPAEVVRLRRQQSDDAWDRWSERRTLAKPQTPQDLQDALLEPESRQYGTDPFTGEPLLAWRGGKGQWVRSKETAIASIQAKIAEQQNAPKRAAHRRLKAEIRSIRPHLTQLVKKHGRGSDIGMQADALLADSENTDDWLTRANQFLYDLQSSNQA